MPEARKNCKHTKAPAALCLWPAERRVGPASARRRLTRPRNVCGHPCSPTMYPAAHAQGCHVLSTGKRAHVGSLAHTLAQALAGLALVNIYLSQAGMFRCARLLHNLPTPAQPKRPVEVGAAACRKGPRRACRVPGVTRRSPRGASARGARPPPWHSCPRSRQSGYTQVGVGGRWGGWGMSGVRSQLRVLWGAYGVDW